MPFKRGNPGCGCCVLAPTICVRVTNCASAIGGDGVTIRRPDGSVLCSGTTDPAGWFCCDADVVGLHAIEVTPADPVYYRDATTSVDVTALAGGGYVATVSLEPALGRLCCDPCYSPRNPLPETLYATDGNGTTALAWDGSRWAGDALGTTVCFDSYGGTATVAVHYEVYCDWLGKLNPTSPPGPPVYHSKVLRYSDGVPGRVCRGGGEYFYSGYAADTCGPWSLTLEYPFNVPSSPGGVTIVLSE